MSRAFDGTGDYLSGACAGFSGAPRTLAAFWKQTVARSARAFGAFDFSSSPESSVGTIAAGSNVTFRYIPGAGVTLNGAYITGTGSWRHYAAVSRAADDHEVFANGASDGTSSGTATMATSVIDRVALATRANFSGHLGANWGECAEFGVWDTDLTDDEIAALADGVSPALIRPTSLLCYLPLIRDADRDIVSGTAMTVGGNPTVGDHPGVIYPTRPIVGIGSAAAPGGISIPVVQHHRLRVGAA